MRSPRTPLAAALALAALSVLAASFGGGGLCTAVPSVSAVGTGSSGAFGAPSIAGVGIPDLDVPGSFSFSITGGFPNAPGVLVLQRRELPFFSSVFQTTIYTGSFGVTVPFICDASGSAVIAPNPISHPIPELCGMDLIAQATIFDFTAPGGATWTNGLRFRFGTTP